MLKYDQNTLLCLIFYFLICVIMHGARVLKGGNETESLIEALVRVASDIRYHNDLVTIQPD